MISKFFKKDKRGSIFVTTIIITLLMVLISGYMFYMISQDIFTARHIRDANEAIYIAEAGLGVAVAILAANFANKDNAALFPLTSFGDGTYDVTVVQTGGRVLLNSVGVVRGISRIACLEPENLTAPGLTYAVGSAINININGKVDIKGNIHSNQNCNLNGSPGPINIHDAGVARAVMHVNTSGTVNYTSKEEWVAPISMPAINFSYYKNLAQNGGKYYSGTLNLSGSGTMDSGTNGVIYCEKDANISGSYTLNGCLVARHINISGTFTQNKVGNLPAFLATGNFNMSGIINAHGFVYSGQNININGYGTITGSLISGGNNSNINNTSSNTFYIIFEQESPPDQPPGGFNVKSWNR